VRVSSRYWCRRCCLKLVSVSCSSHLRMSQPTPEELQCFSSEERASLLQLAAAQENLVLDASDAVETRTEKGFDAAQTFLNALESVAETMRVQPASRAYRLRFAENFPSLQMQDGRDYSVAVLEACMSLSRSRSIWANGQQYALSHEADVAATALRDEWECFFSHHLDWLMSDSPEPERSTLYAAIVRVDERWADFEHSYMQEIVKVQDKAKGLVYTAIGFERALLEMEEEFADSELADSTDYHIKLSAFLACIIRLNVAANPQRKTEELSLDIWETAKDLLEVCSFDPSHTLQAARAIAQQVVTSFSQLRVYLREVREHIADLDPQLCHNPGLVTHLTRWEETWIIGARYLQTRQVLGAVCRLVPEMQRAQQSLPAFQQMCSDCDPALFLVLPRLVWLSFLTRPGSLNDLLGNLLPHRFVMAPIPWVLSKSRDLHSRGLRRQRSEPNLSAPSAVSQELGVLGMGSELKALRDKHSKAQLVLQEFFGTVSSAELGRQVQEVLIRRAVTGADASALEDPYEFLSSAEQSQQKLVRDAVEDLMLDLEGWSMELQRHNAEDWNECINVLVQCISEE